MLDNKIGNLQFINPEKVHQNSAEKQNKKNNFNTSVIIGASLITLSTIGGIIYFTKHGAGRKINTNGLSGFSETAITPPVYSAPNSSAASPNGKVHWSALTTRYRGEQDSWSTNSTDKIKNSKNVHKQHGKNWRQRREDEVIPGIIQQISGEIKDYIRLCGINKTNNKINPERLDEILTKAVGTDNVTECPYTVKGKHGAGRIKKYTSPNGMIYILETHDSATGIVTRLYTNHKDKNLRAYLHSDGTFRLNTYNNRESHFATTAKGIRWMQKGKYYTQGVTN